MIYRSQISSLSSGGVQEVASDHLKPRGTSLKDSEFRPMSDGLNLTVTILERLLPRDDDLRCYLPGYMEQIDQFAVWSNIRRGSFQPKLMIS
jgi:hypothetical protein